MLAQTTVSYPSLNGPSGAVMLVILLTVGGMAFVVLTVMWALRKSTAGIMPEGFVGVMRRFGSWSPRLIDERFWRVGPLTLPIPGRFYIRFPALTEVVTVEVRERVADTPEQKTIIDGAPVTFDLKISWKVVDPYSLLRTYQDYVARVVAALSKAALTAISEAGLKPFLRRDVDYIAEITARVHQLVELEVPGVQVVSVNFEDVDLDKMVAAAMVANMLGSSGAERDLAHIRELLRQVPALATAFDDPARAVQILAAINGAAVVPTGSQLPPPSPSR